MKYSLGLIVFLLVAIQFIPSKVINPKTAKDLEIKAPKEVMAIFRKSCYDCHSNQTNIPWYASVAPASFFIKRHVDIGRRWLNFSIWNSYTPKEKDKKLGEIYKSIYHAMPLPNYLKVHKDAKLTKPQIELIQKWTGKIPY